MHAHVYKMLLMDTKFKNRPVSSWVAKIIIILPKLTYKPNAIPIKILVGLCYLFVLYDYLILVPKCILEENLLRFANKT